MGYGNANTRSLIGLTLFLLLLIPSVAGAAAFPKVSIGSCGVAEDVVDVVYVTRADKRQQLTENFELRESDTITTGPAGGVKLRLIDNTEVILGADSTAHIVELVFREDKARLQVHVDQGSARIKTGAIGLKNPKGVRIMTPKNLIMPSNCILSLIERYEEEILQVEWMPKGPTISLYNPRSEKVVEIDEQGTVLVTNREGEIFAGSREER